MTDNLEILAPAGTWEAMEAAINAGANAIYLGGTAFGARQYADNFDREHLAKAIVLAHLHRVRIYVTVNTLVDDSELNELGDYLVFLHNIGIDGIIVQDMGVIRLARQVVPDLPLHASTQMTITNSAGAKFAYDAGMERAVVARETTLKDLQTICRTTPGEIETFIHGALCVCYSGQCLMSSLIGGRSGNRGRCAQPCRLPYTLINKDDKDLLADVDAGQYLLSPKDMNTLDVLPQLIETGVVSFKIEGRMKRPEYVAVVTDIYRRALDSYLAGDYQVPQQDKENIEQIFNRDFTTAYLEKKPGRTMMSDRRPNNRGVLIGRVVELNKQTNTAVVKLDKNIAVGDGLEFWVSVGGRVGTTLEAIKLQGEAVQSAVKGDKVEIAVPRGIRMNDRVFRVFDAHLMAYAGKFYGEHNKKRLPVTAVVTAHLGQPLTVKLTDEEGNVGQGKTEFIVETARKHALTREVVQKQMDRLGTSEYVLTDLQLQADDNVMVPMSEINEARRIATEELNQRRLESFLPKRVQKRWQKNILNVRGNNSLTRHAALAVQVDTLAKAQAALQNGADLIIAGGDCFTRPGFRNEDYAELARLAHASGKKWAVATSRIVAEKDLAYYQQVLKHWQSLQPEYILVANNGLWNMAKQTGLPVWADFSLNTYNIQSILFWQSVGARGITLSPELTMQQVGQLAQETPLPIECLVEGPLEMMVSEYCIQGSFLGDLHTGKCSYGCREQGYLKDRKDACFPLAHDQFGRMHVLNCHPLSMVTSAKAIEALGVQVLRMDGRNYEMEKLSTTVQLYRNVLDGVTTVEENIPHTTRGHYFRGVL